MRVGIIGAGLQGVRRSRVLRRFENTTLAMIADINLEKARLLAGEMNCEATDKWEEIVNSEDIDTVVVCTPPHLHAQMCVAAMERGKHVLCEKPLAISLDEAKAMLTAADRCGVKLKCGFNHRYHPGIKKAKEWVAQGIIGSPILVRGYYGICGRPDYEKEWRVNPDFVSGGQLMEQGIHLVDLCRWFLGEFSEVTCFLGTLFWQMLPFEDNAFVVFRSSSGTMASIHSSLTQWKNAFSFELVGKDGYITVTGLGGGYGTEKLTIGKRDFFKPFEDSNIEFRGEDISWYEEWKEFKTAVQEGSEMMGSGLDGYEALKLVFAAYESNKKGSVVRL